MISVPTIITIRISRNTSSDPVLTDRRRIRGENSFNTSTVVSDRMSAKPVSRLRSCQAFSLKMSLRLMVMMAAMMLPSAMPLLVSLDRIARNQPSRHAIPVLAALAYLAADRNCHA